MLALAQAMKSHFGSRVPFSERPLADRFPEGLNAIEPRAQAAFAPVAIQLQPETVKCPCPVLPRTADRPAAVVIETVAETPAARRRPGVPGWAISLLVATALSLGGAVVIRNTTAVRRAEAAQPATHGLASQETSAPFIEVTGLRVVADVNRRLHVQYVVVNHSAAQVSNLVLRIAVRSALASSPEPLFTISALLTGLGPFASREVVTDVEDVRAPNIPDWQYLKPKVQIVSQ